MISICDQAYNPRPEKNHQRYLIVADYRGIIARLGQEWVSSLLSSDSPTGPRSHEAIPAESCEKSAATDEEGTKVVGSGDRKARRREKRGARIGACGTPARRECREHGSESRLPEEFGR